MNSEDMADGIRGRLNAAVTQIVRESEAVSVPPRIADYTMLRRIGGGSYGDVWLARSATGQWRAVKVVWRKNFSSERPYDREFSGIVQFEPISRSHPGVVNVLHVGRDDAAGCFFYVMELADAAGERVGKWKSEQVGTDAGVNLSPAHSLTSSLSNYSPRTLAADLKSHGRLSVSDALRLGVQLADALGHLHRHGLVHRDVKPSNLIFVSGQPKLADIGLVTTVEEARSFVGTEGFIPPEGPGTEKADLFALGRPLYEAATGKDRCEFPQLPADLETWPAPEREALLELNEVLAKLCAPNQADRHDNAAEVAGDLNLILAGRSVRRAYGIERRLRRATQVSAAALAVGALAVGVVWFQRSQQRQAEGRATQERALRQRAEAAERAVRGHLYAALLEQARATARNGELGQRVRALDAIRSAAAISNTVELRQAAFAALALPDLNFESELTFAQNDGRVFDPPFERYAVCVDRGPVEIHAASDRRLLVSLPAVTNGVGYVKYWSQDGHYLAIKRDVDGPGDRADLEVWNLVSTQRVLYARDFLTERALSFHPSLPQIASSRIGGGVTVWDLESGQQIRQFKLQATTIYWLCFAPDGKRIAASYDHAGSHRVAILDADTGELQTTIPCLDTVIGLAWQPQGRWLAVPDFAGNVRLIDPKTGEARILGQHKAQAVNVDFSPDGNFLISGGWEQELICWDTRTMRRAFTIGINAHDAQFSRDGRKCAIQMADRLQIYAFQAPGACREMPEELGRTILHAAFSPDGQWFAASGSEFLGVWDLGNGGPAVMVPSGELGVPFFSPTASEIYAYGSRALARWQMTPADKGAPPELTKLPLWVPPGLQCASIRSNELVSTCYDCVRFMPLGNTNMDNVRYLAKASGWGNVSPDGRWLGVRDYSTPWLRVYHLPEVEKVACLTNRADVCNFAFSLKSDQLAIVTRNGLEFYDTTLWQRTRELPIHCERFGSIHFAPDGESFWFTSDRRTSALRDTRSLQVLLPLPPGTMPLAVSPDGRRLAVSVDFRRVQLWDLAEVKERFGELRLDWTSPR